MLFLLFSYLLVELFGIVTVWKYALVSELVYQNNSEPFKGQFLKMVKHTQTIRRQTADELFEYV